MVSSCGEELDQTARGEAIRAQARGHQRDAHALLGREHHRGHGVQAHQPIRLDRSDLEPDRPAFPRVAPLLVQQQILAVQIGVGLDRILGQEMRRTGRDEALREQLVHREPLPGSGADDDRQVGLRRMRLRRARGGLDADVGLFARLREGGEPRQEQRIGEERRDVQADDAAPVAHSELFGDRLELREDVADVLEVVRARRR